MSDANEVRLECAAGVARVWIERPDVHNAFDAAVIAGLDQAIAEASGRDDVRAIVLGGRGRSFSAGADLKWMKAADLSEEQNVEGARRLAAMLRRLERSPKVTIARVQGAALGGGLGLLAACDVAFAAARATFGFSEVKLGLVPAVISPFVIAKIGPGHARRLFVTGERFGADFAHRIGLIHQVVEDEEALDGAIDQVLAQVALAGPGAVAAAKELVREVESARSSEELDATTARLIARLRVSPEGQEGIGAFFAKRPPAWAPKEADA